MSGGGDFGRLEKSLKSFKSFKSLRSKLPKFGGGLVEFCWPNDARRAEEDSVGVDEVSELCCRNELSPRRFGVLLKRFEVFERRLEPKPADLEEELDVVVVEEVELRCGNGVSLVREEEELGAFESTSPSALDSAAKRASSSSLFSGAGFCGIPRTDWHRKREIRT